MPCVKALISSWLKPLNGIASISTGFFLNFAMLYLCCKLYSLTFVEQKPSALINAAIAERLKLDKITVPTLYKSEVYAMHKAAITASQFVSPAYRLLPFACFYRFELH